MSGGPGRRSTKAVVYVVWHTHQIRPRATDHAYSDGDVLEEDLKELGVFSSRAKADAWVLRMKAAPGFKEQPDNFTIDQYVLDEDSWPDGPERVFPPSG